MNAAIPLILRLQDTAALIVQAWEMVLFCCHLLACHLMSPVNVTVTAVPWCSWWFKKAFSREICAPWGTIAVPRAMQMARRQLISIGLLDLRIMNRHKRWMVCHQFVVSWYFYDIFFWDGSHSSVLPCTVFRWRWLSRQGCRIWSNPYIRPPWWLWLQPSATFQKRTAVASFLGSSNFWTYLDLFWHPVWLKALRQTYLAQWGSFFTLSLQSGKKCHYRSTITQNEKAKASAEMSLIEKLEGVEI